MNQKIKDTPRELRCTVISIIPFAIEEMKPGLHPNTFRVPSCDDEERPSVLAIGTCFHYVYIDGDRGSLQVRDQSSEVAESIVNDYISSQICVREGARPGIMWAPGDLSADAFIHEFKREHLEMKIAQRRWFFELCKMADNDWKRYQQHNVISEFQRIAASKIKLSPQQHPWMDMTVPTTAPESGPKCPSCGAPYIEGLFVCSSCRYILNKEKYDPADFAKV